MKIQTGSITTTNASVTISLDQMLPSQLVSIHGAYSGLSAVFELSSDDQTNFYQIPAISLVNNASIANIAPPDNSSNVYFASTFGANQFRIRRTALTSGTVSVSVISSAFSAPNALGMSGVITSSAAFARPANTTAYASLAAVSNSTSSPTALTFTNALGKPGNCGYITKVRVVTDQKTNTARYRLHLYNAAPTAINDGTAFPLLYANRASKLGSLDLVACATEDATSSTAASSQNIDSRLAIVGASGDANVYGLLETLDAFTPASAQNYYVEITVDAN